MSIPRARRTRRRMTSAERREQLIAIARTLFATQGLDGTSVEEIAATAEVSKPVVYEHFGGKEGLYETVVTREVAHLEAAIHEALATPGGFRLTIERGSLALLNYIDECPDGFRIISRDASTVSAEGSFSSILNDIADQVTDLLATPLARHGYDPKLGAVFAQGLVGLVASAGQHWLEDRSLSKQELAAQMTNLAWNGLANLEKNTLASSRPAPAADGADSH